MRINKYLSSNDIASRRKADQMVEEGRVKVNGIIAGTGMDVLEGDIVEVDGNPINTSQKKVYLIMNKPKGYITSVNDDRGRKTVLDLIKEDFGRIYPVGRLDYDSEGLLVLTNDGDLCDRLTHPRNEIKKTYQVKLEGLITEQEISRLLSGVEIEEGIVVKAHKVKLLSVADSFTKIEMVISEGRNRQVRSMLKAIKKEVAFLKRVKIGDLRLASLGRGEYRQLTPQEVEYIKTM